MRYLFIDIECADGNRAICEFGYVLTNNKLEIINKNNYIINPECEFNLTNRKGQKDLELTYPYEEYCKKDDFREFYETIKFLLTQKDILIFGHAVKNDIRFLVKDIKRYNLEVFNFEAYDIQNMLPVFDKHNKRYTSLEEAYKDLVPSNVRNDLLDHRASDDAHKTMLVFKYMVNDLGFSPIELIESCDNSKCSVEDYINERKAYREREKQIKKLHKVIDKGQKMWGELCKDSETYINESSIGKLVTISAEIKKHVDELELLIDYIKANEYFAYNQIDGSDYFITFDEENRNELETKLKRPYGGRIMTLQEFLKLNNI